MATIGGSAYLLMAMVCLFTGWYTDRRIAAGSSPSIVRKSFLGAGSGLSAVLILSSAFASDGASVVLFLLACASFGLVSPNVYAVAQSFAGASAAGRWVGIQNCIGNGAGLVAPFLTGVLIDRTGNFTLAFLITSAVCVVAGLAWTIGIGPVAEIDWARRDRVSVANRVAIAPVT
jgi:MFS family permease